METCISRDALPTGVGRLNVLPPLAMGMPPKWMASCARSSPSERLATLVLGGQVGAFSAGLVIGVSLYCWVRGSRECEAFLHLAHGGFWRVGGGKEVGGDGALGSQAEAPISHSICH